MPSDLPEVAATILHTLLDRFEQPGRRSVVRVWINNHWHPDYFSSGSFGARRATNLALDRLEQDGVVKLKWQKWERGNWLNAVDLLPEGAAVLYALLERTPRGAQVESLADMLAGETARAPWHAAFLDGARSQLAEQRLKMPLTLNDPRWNCDLLRALDAIARLRQPTLERSLSVRVFGNSKRLEELRSAIVKVLRRYDPAAARYGDDSWALLGAHYLERVPEYVPVAGPVALRRGDQQIDLDWFAPNVALSAAMLRNVEVVRCAANAVITVENATSFSELTAIRPARVLTLYTGGFASPSVIALLQRIRAARPDLPFYHWGDLDAGGLRILAHLRAQLGAITPLGMDISTFAAHESYAQPLSSHDRIALLGLRAQPDLADCVPLIDALLAANHKLEQEAVSADAVLQSIMQEPEDADEAAADHRGNDRGA